MHTQLAELPKRIGKTHDRVKQWIHTHRIPATIEARTLPGEPVDFAEAVAGEYEPFQTGTAWGRAWGTTWFRVSVEIPDGVAGGLLDGKPVELIVDPGFTPVWPGFQSEALAWTEDGTPIKGIEPRTTYLSLPRDLAGGDTWTVYVEAASNPGVHNFGDTVFSDLDTVPDRPLYTFACADLATLEPDVFGLDLDIAVLNELQGELPQGSARKAQILTGLERAIDALDMRDIPGTAAAAREHLAPLLAQPANASEHVVSATGHAHIDSAWLWPIRETQRKCARTFANVVTLAEDYPDLVFSCSQVVQYAWMRDRYPAIFERMKKAVSDGTWAPVSGMWVECDANLPGGEAMVRQFTYGKRFLEEEFGYRCREVWLPDTFGYSGALPQICRLAEGEYFLSQKMSWNTTDVFPHNTFWWEGIDGTRVFTHFPPADTYNSQVLGAEVMRSASNFRDAGPVNRSLLLFGYGDGGGGPTREMVERARRYANLEGSPKVVIEKPETFFDATLAEYPEAPVWAGEMYLEFHRGTYTTHVATKQGNRRTEHLLYEAELLWATASLLVGAEYPYDEIDELWRTALLHQFHDILPGSSIRWVHREAAATFAELRDRLEDLIGRALAALGDGDAGVRSIVNTAPHSRGSVPAFGAAPPRPRPVPTQVSQAGDVVTLDNGFARVVVGADGTITSLVDLRTGRELVPAGQRAGLLQLHPDTPNQYEAWDIEAYYKHTRTDLDEHDGIEVDGDEVVVRRRFGSSSATQRLRLVPGEACLTFTTEVDWHERERLLKLAFPLDLHALTYESEIQFGYVTRPAHGNTTWDAAKFETAAQRWVRVAEGDYGVALINKGTYGHDVSRPEVGDSRGSLPTTVRMTLVRGPLYPDPRADEGTHTFECELLLGARVVDATREGYAFALSEREVAGPGWSSVVTSDGEGVVVSAVKLADDRSGDVIVRVYEALGRRTTARLGFGFDVAEVGVVNLLERTDGVAETLCTPRPTDGGVDLDLRPFQIVTLRIRR